MKSQLDELIEDLRSHPLDPDLSAIERETWRRIEQMRHARSADVWLLPARAGAVVFALTAGAVFGAAHARESASHPEVAAFEVASGFAPSTLLDKH